MRRLFYTLLLLNLSLVMCLQSCDNRSANSQIKQMQALCDSAALLYEDGKYQQAYEIFKTIEISDYCDRPLPDKLMGKTWLHIAWIHYFHKDYNTSYYYTSKSDSVFSLMQDTTKMINAKSHLSCLLSLMGRFEEADSVNKVIDAVWTDRLESLYGWRVEFNKGLNSFYKGNVPDGIVHFRKSLKLVDASDAKKGSTASIYSGLADCFKLTGPKDSIIKYLDLTERDAFQSDQRHLIVESLRDQMLFHTEQGDREIAIQYQKRYLTFLDSLLNTESFLNTQSVFNARKEAFTNSRISDLNVTVSRQWTGILVSVIIAFLLLVVALLLYGRSRVEKKANKALYDKYQLLLEKESASEGTNKDKSEENEELDGDQKKLLDMITISMQEPSLWCDPEFDLKRLADKVNSSPRAISELLNNILHVNFRSFVGKYRVREACLRMKSKEYSHYSIDGIGESVGFGSRHTFLRTFKKETGILPSIYRRLCQEE